MFLEVLEDSEDMEYSETTESLLLYVLSFILFKKKRKVAVT
ncbi:11732_t:CDS:1, partial [Funneliformis caledonium]